MLAGCFFLRQLQTASAFLTQWKASGSKELITHLNPGCFPSRSLWFKNVSCLFCSVPFSCSLLFVHLLLFLSYLVLLACHPTSHLSCLPSFFTLPKPSILTHNPCFPASSFFSTSLTSLSPHLVPKQTVPFCCTNRFLRNTWIQICELTNGHWFVHSMYGCVWLKWSMRSKFWLVIRPHINNYLHDISEFTMYFHMHCYLILIAFSK